jgi:hypothetical protein
MLHRPARSSNLLFRGVALVFACGFLAPTGARAQGAVDAERIAAEWVVANGGSIVGVKMNRTFTAHQGRPLPEGEFSVAQVSFVRSKLQDADLQRLKPFVGLKTLSFFNMPIGDTGVAHITGFDRLYQLTLTGSEVTDAGLAPLLKLPNLRVLMLTRAKIGDVGLKTLAECKNLRELRLEETNVTDAGLAHLAKLSTLRELILNQTAVTGSGVAALERCKSLEVLRLNQCPLADGSIAEFAKLTQLKKLYAANTKLTPAGTDALAKALPNCLMSFDGKTIPPAAVAKAPLPQATPPRRAMPLPELPPQPRGPTAVSPRLRVTVHPYIGIRPIERFFEAPIPTYLAGSTVYGDTGFQSGRDARTGFVEVEVLQPTSLYLACTFVRYAEFPNLGPEPTSYDRLLRDGWVDVCDLHTGPNEPRRHVFWKSFAAGEKVELRTSRHFTPLVIVPQDPTSNPLDLVPNDTQTTAEAKSTSLSKVERLLRTKQFDALEALAAKLRREKKYNADGEAELTIFYDGLNARGETDAEWADDLKLYEAWVAAKPDSLAAHYALIRYWTKYGWFERNKFYTKREEPTEAAWEIFRERCEKGDKLREKIAKRPGHDMHVYFLAFESALFLTRPPKVLDEIVANSLESDPDYISVAVDSVRYYLPRWSGAIGAVERQSAKVAALTKARHGDSLYALGAMRAADFDGPSVLKQHSFDWERVKRGFVDLRKRFPKSLDYDVWNAKFASFMEDRTEAQQAFARIDSYPKHTYHYDAEMKKWRGWASADFHAGDQLAVYETLKHPVRRLEWTVDDRRWIVFDDQAELAVFDAADGKLLSRVATHTTEPRFAAVIPFGKTVVAAGRNGVVSSYKIPSGEVRELGKHEPSIQAAALSSDGGEFATLSMNGKVNFWELDAEESFPYEWDLAPARLLSLAFIPNSRNIALGGFDGSVTILDRDDKSKKGELPNRKTPIGGLRVSPDGTTLAVLTYRELTLWRVKDLTLISTFTSGEYQIYDDFAFSRDGKSLAAAGVKLQQTMSRGLPPPLPPPVILVWNTTDGKLRHKLTGHKAQIRSLCFNSDGTRLVTGSDDMTIRVWKVD